MDAGGLDQRIVIEARTVERDELGADVETWALQSNPWAKVIETAGREFLKGEVIAERKAVFVIRWQDLDTTARVTWGSRTYRIDAITGTRRSAQAWLQCTEQS